MEVLSLCNVKSRTNKALSHQFKKGLASILTEAFPRMGFEKEANKNYNLEVIISTYKSCKLSESFSSWVSVGQVCVGHVVIAFNVYPVKQMQTLMAFLDHTLGQL